MNFVSHCHYCTLLFKQNQQDATLHNGIYYYNALHVSGGSSTHHQELKTVYTASGICRAFTASYCLLTQAVRSSESSMLCIQF